MLPKGTVVTDFHILKVHFSRTTVVTDKVGVHSE